MPNKVQHLKQGTIIVLILFLLGWHLALPVDFIRSDLGRHIKNGELVLHGHWDVLYKNYYSYTHPEYPFINHHWLFGVFCYVCWHYFGFTGLSLIYLILELFTFYVFFCCWQRYSSFAMACAIGLLSFPLISSRIVIRPEGISYLFCGLFWWMIDAYQQKRLKSHHLIIGLCVLQIIWVNTHIFFIMGPILTALFWLQMRINKEEEQAVVLQKLFLLLLVMCMINPSGIDGAMTPFHVDKAYSFPIQENSSVFSFFIEKNSLFRSILLYFLAVLGMLLAAVFFLIRREGLKKNIFIVTLALLTSIAALKAERLTGLFIYFWIPLSTYAYGRWMQAETVKVRKIFEIVLVALGIIVSVSVNFNWNQRHSLGIVPGANHAAEFFKREKILGPIFNNYDIGGYLIFYLSPQHKFFVDNRMEAFPEDFFSKTYIPLQWNDDAWSAADQKYHFNVIFITPELSVMNFKFLLHRFMDPAWAPVFIDGDAIILLKRNAQNAQIIKHNEILTDQIRMVPPSNGKRTQIIVFYKGALRK